VWHKNLIELILRRNRERVLATVESVRNIQFL
jgi:hypothetical protein